MKKISASEQVEGWLLSLAPEPKRDVRAALRRLAAGQPVATLALRRELDGFHRLRIGGWRVIYRVLPGRRIHLDYASSRDVVYDTFRHLLALRPRED